MRSISMIVSMVQRNSFWLKPLTKNSKDVYALIISTKRVFCSSYGVCTRITINTIVRDEQL